MDIDFSSFLPKEGESTKEYYARALGAGVSADAPASERAQALPDMPAVKTGTTGELRVPSSDVKPASSADDIINHLYKNANLDPVNSGGVYSGARGLAASANSLNLGPKQAARIRTRGYDFATAQTTKPTAASPDLQHFERMHGVLEEFEAHVEHHSRLIKQAGGSLRALDGVWNSLGKAYEKVGQAREEHESGNVLESRKGNKVLAKGAHPLLGAAVKHLTNAAAQLEAKTNGAYDAVNAGHVGHATIIRNNYGIKTPQKDESAMQGALRGAGYVSEGKAAYDDDGFEVSPPKPLPQRLPLLDPTQRAAQRRDMAQKRDVSPKTVVGSEQDMGENRLGLGVVQGPAKEGEVRTPSGGFAPQADVERVRQRIQARDAEVAQQQQDNATKLKEERKPAPYPTAPKPATFKAEYTPIKVAKKGKTGKINVSPERDSSGETKVETLDTNTPIIAPVSDRLYDEDTYRYKSPVNRYATQEVDRAAKPPIVEESRINDAEARQVRVKALSSWRTQQEAIGLAARVARSQKVDEDNRAKTQDLINSGNVSEAASHHYGMSYLYHRDLKTVAGKRRIDAVKNNPAEYLRWHGFDAGSSGQQSQGTIPNSSKQTEMPRVSKKPATKSAKASSLEAAITEFGGQAPVAPRSTPSMISTESQAEYEAKLKRGSGTTRAQRNNAAFRGEA